MAQGNQLPWTEDQWAMIQQEAQRGARRARVASSFLPLSGPFGDPHTTVPALVLKEGARAEHLGAVGRSASRLEVDDSEVLKVTTLAVDLHLTSAQVEDPELVVVRSMVARAADVVGRLEDAIVFNGQPEPGAAPSWVEPDGSHRSVRPEVFTVSGGQRNGGLLGADRVECEIEGDALVAVIVRAITTLEGRGHFGPFVVALGSAMFLAASSPRQTHVLPSDRLTPFLDRPLLRSVVVPSNQGVVVSLSNAAVDLAVAKDVAVSFLQVTLEPRWVLRVSEKCVLRVKEAGSVITLVGTAPAVSPT